MGYDNLDLRCARAAAELVQKASSDSQLEKLCIDASAVLSASGPYAFFLYLRSREEKPASAAPMFDACYRALAEWFPPLSPQTVSERGRMLERIAALSENLDSLLLAKKLLSRILTYLRYHAKAFGKLKGTPALSTAAR